MNTSERSSAIEAAAVILAAPNAVFLKVETTGLTPRDEVVVAAIVGVGPTGVSDSAVGAPRFRSFVRARGQREGNENGGIRHPPS